MPWERSTLSIWIDIDEDEVTRHIILSAVPFANFSLGQRDSLQEVSHVIQVTCIIHMQEESTTPLSCRNGKDRPDRGSNPGLPKSSTGALPL
jgi:hypothetical protein